MPDHDASASPGRGRNALTGRWSLDRPVGWSGASKLRRTAAKQECSCGAPVRCRHQFVTRARRAHMQAPPAFAH